MGRGERVNWLARRHHRTAKSGSIGSTALLSLLEGGRWDGRAGKMSFPALSPYRLVLDRTHPCVPHTYSPVHSALHVAPSSGASGEGTEQKLLKKDIRTRTERNRFTTLVALGAAQRASAGTHSASNPYRDQFGSLLSVSVCVYVCVCVWARQWETTKRRHYVMA